jgi:hypothetical protein
MVKPYGSSASRFLRRLAERGPRGAGLTDYIRDGREEMVRVTGRSCSSGSPPPWRGVGDAGASNGVEGMR